MGHLGGGQPALGFPALRLLGGQPLQGGWRIVGQIPLDKLGAEACDVPNGGKVMPFPERRAAPQAIELFDLAIAFWFGHRQENQFDAEVQAQPHELAEDPRGFVAATQTRRRCRVAKSLEFPGFSRWSGNGR